MPRITEPGRRRSETAQSHRLAVERTIEVMEEQLYEDLTLRDLAEVGIMSPHHFNRVFRYVTGVPPVRFLTARRIAEAKRLLLTTSLRITDICFEVGYNSLGTFTRRFGELVGVSPRRFRRLAKRRHRRKFDALAAAAGRENGAAREAAIRGRISTPQRFEGKVVAGLFETPIPQGRPIACTVAAVPGPFALDDVPDGDHYLYAVALPSDPQPREILLFEDALRGGARKQPVRVRDGRCETPVDVALHPPQSIDRPILLSLPPLIEEWLDTEGDAPARAEDGPANA